MTREQEISRVGYVGVGTNVLLSGFKALIGVLSGSLAILLDAVNNLSDVLSSVITIVGTKLGAKPADKHHPFGHGRYEYISALMIAFLIFGAGVMALYNAVLKILHPTPVKYDFWAYLVIVAAILTKILLSRYTKRRGEQLQSTSLIASGTDAMFDVFTSVATLVSALVFSIFGLNIDGWAGLLISFVIIRGGILLVRETTDDILGRRIDAALSRSIKADIRGVEGVKGAYDLSVNAYGPSKMVGAVEIEVDENMKAREIHELSHRINREIFSKYGLDLYIGVFAESRDEESLRLKGEIAAFIKEKYPQVLQIHAFNFDAQKGRVRFDAVLDFSLKDRKVFCEKLVEDLETRWRDYSFVLNQDSDLSD